METPRRIWLVICIAGVLSLKPTPASAQAQGTTTIGVIPLSVVAENVCYNNWERVDITGQVQVETHVTIDDAGTFHLVQNSRATGQGVGEISGANYTYDDYSHLVLKSTDPLPFDFRNRQTITLVGVGVPDQVVRFYTVIRIDAQGNVKTFIDTATVDCS